MKRLLIASSLDVLGSSNSRTHHLVRHLSHHFDETFAISRINITGKSLWTKLTALFRVRTRVIADGKIWWVGMTHIGSIRHGLGHHILGMQNPHIKPAHRVRRMLRWVFSTLGVVFELGILPSYIITFFTRVRGRIDIFIGEGAWEVLFGLFLRTIGHADIVVCDDIDYTPGFQPVSGLRRRMTSAIEQFGVSHADVVVSVGNRLASLRRKQGADNVRVIPNGVDVDRFGRAQNRRDTMQSHPPSLIYMGYLGSWSGVDLLIQAVVLASHKIRNLRLILLGHGGPSDIEVLLDSIRTRKLEKIIDYRGDIPYQDLPEHLAEADIGVAMFRPLDLTQYAFPLKVVEYMAAGLTVITTVGTEAADLVQEAGAGIAVPFDAGTVAEVIVKLLQNPEDQRRYAANARSFSTRYDWKKLMKEYYSLVQTVK